MVNEELLGGLKAALNRGESLRQAMMSFYNANYKKEEIEEAAKALQIEQQQSPLQPAQSQPAQQPEQKSIQRVSSYGEKPTQSQPSQQIESKPKEILSQPTKAVQRVSNYEQKTTKPRKEWLLFIMMALLLVLVGILAAVFLFKSELMELFNKMFGV